MNVILVRHTRLKGNEGVCYGRTNFPVADTFERETEELIARLPWKPEWVWTSPAKRCRVLAELIASGAMVTADERLAELHFGEWEGKHWSDLAGAEVDKWMANPFHARPPGGETVPEFVARVTSFRRQLLSDDAAATRGTAIVTHAGVIRVWRSLETGVPLDEVFKQPVAYGEIGWIDRSARCL